MGRHVLDPGVPDRRRPSRSRWLLYFAIVSSAVVVAASSALITSFFVSARSATDAPSGSAVPLTGRPLTIALARTPGGSREWRTYASAIRRMSDAAGRPMLLRYVGSRSEMSELLLTGRVDAAFMCIYCYLQVADEPGVSLVAAPVIDGQAKDAAVLVARPGSGYGSLADLRGRRIGVTEPTSLGGYAYLLWLAEQNGVDAARSLVLVPADSQEQSIRALLAEDVEAAVVNRSQLAAWGDAGLRVIATSPEFGMPPFVTGPTVDPATRDLMQRALLTMRPSLEITPTSVGGFTAPVRSDYDFARTLVRYTPRPEGTE